MSTPYHIICLKNQKAAKAYLEGQALGNVTNIFRGLTASQQVLPCIVLECNQASFIPTNRGNFLANLSVKVRQNADGKSGVDEDRHQLDAGTIFDLFMTDSIAADLTSALQGAGDDYTCFFVEGVSQGYSLNGNVWESELVLQLNCAGNSVA
jgi:hypothetical protein